MMGTSEVPSETTFISYENYVYLGGACNVGKSTLASILIGEEISQHWKSTDGLNSYFGRNGIDLKKKKMVPLKQATIQEDIKEEIRNGTYKIEIAPSDLVECGGQRSFHMAHQLFMQHKGTFVLMFNGSINFSDPLKEYNQGETTESILKQCVNSILSYCVDDEDILPTIMFSATHSDYFNPEDCKDRKKKLILNLREIFKDHKQQHCIKYDDIFFINGQNKNDPEINKLKSKLGKVACKQKSWGKRMPMAWVPLDLQMSELRLHNMNIISKEELITLNQRNENLVLTVEQIKNFLNVQHSLGNILYFEQQGLDHFIIVQPQSLVNILRSFITDKLFWPKDEELRGILCTFTNTGKIAKQDLLKLWSQEKFHQHMPNDDFKEFIIQVLVHLDILVEPKHYRQEQESQVKSYLVPCIVKCKLPVTDCVKSADKMIYLSYSLLKYSIPAALSFMLIGAAINVWHLKEAPEEGICLYHQAAIIFIDGSNELHLSIEDDKVFVYLINKVNKSLIPPNIASMVQECLTSTMTKVRKFYHESFGKSLSTSKVSEAFEIEDGEWCTSGAGCNISIPKVTEKTEWRSVITKHLENVTCIEDQSLSLACELAEKDISVTWLKDEKVIEASKNIVPEVHNYTHSLKFKKLSKTDGGKYTLMARGEKTEAVVLVIAKSTIPDQILLMDEKDKEMYLEIIKSGTERRYYIRLMIVGESGVGKTCLMRRLLGKDIDGVTSTDGIDVVIRKCKVRLSDGKWILNEEDRVKEDRNVRIKRAVVVTDKETILPEAKKRAEPNPLECIHIENKDIQFGEVLDEALVKNVTEIKHIYTGKGMDQANDTDMQFTNELMESSAESVQLHEDKDVALKSERHLGVLDTLLDVMNVELPKEFFADCAIWDFAGQKEFYATHQTFLTNSAIYLLTIDLSKEPRLKKIYDVNFDQVGCCIDFWLNTIHCYATDQSVESTLDNLEPRIIIVCTGTDKVEGKLNEQKALFHEQLNLMLQGNCTRKHIKSIQYLSNKEPLEKDFLELQSAIFETAKEMSSWGKELPLRWIHLETALDGERDAGSNILPFHLIVKLAKDNSLPTTDDEEIILFLRYQHECGHVIFFTDSPDYIILNPRWVIDAFKCLVSADQFQGHLLHLEDWTELEETGRLTNKLISKLFEKIPKLKFTENKEHLLHVLEKFDIIVKPKNKKKMTSYYMPSMIKALSFNEICNQFGVHAPSCHRTSWLLLEFEFLPPAFFNRVLVGYIRKFEVSIASTGNGKRLSLYRGIGVFDINKSGCRKLVLCADKNLIALQIWIYDDVLDSIFHDFQQTLTNMVNMLSKRYQICCNYEVKMKCSESDYQKTEGRLKYTVFQDDETYFCPEHHGVHKYLDVYKYWFSDKVVGSTTLQRAAWEASTELVDILLKENETCKPGCPVTNDEFLQQRPTDRHLQRLSLEYTIYEVCNIMVFSGLPYADWKALYISTELSDEMKKFVGLKICCEKNALTFKQLKNVVEKDSIQTAHTICKVLRDKFIDFDLEPEKWDLVLTDKFIDKLAPLVGSKSLQFLLELDMTFQDWEQIKHKQSERDLVRLNCDILEAWKQTCYKYNVRPTLRYIGRAFGNIGKHIKIIENILFD